MQPTHGYAAVEGKKIFYREAGSLGAPTVLLLHGSPSSSFQFRFVLQELSDNWRLIAPDMPAFGFTEIVADPPESFTFDYLALTVRQFIERLRLTVDAAYLHDYGAQVGFRLLTSDVIRPKALIIQNSEAYHGIGWREPMWGVEKRLTTPREKSSARLRQAFLTKAGIEREFTEDLPPDIANKIDPASVELRWNKVNSPGTVEATLNLLMDYGSNIERYPQVQGYLRAKRFPTLLLWGELDQYLSPDAARAYRQDLPDAELCFFGGGHWLLESHIKEVNAAVRDFLSARLK